MARAVCNAERLAKRGAQELSFSLPALVTSWGSSAAFPQRGSLRCTVLPPAAALVPGLHSKPVMLKNAHCSVQALTSQKMSGLFL